jgi:hypothetical protein
MGLTGTIALGPLNKWGTGLVCNGLKIKDISCLADKIYMNLGGSRSAARRTGGKGGPDRNGSTRAQ